MVQALSEKRPESVEVGVRPSEAERDDVDSVGATVRGGLPEPSQGSYYALPKPPIFRVSSCSYRPPVGTQFQLRVAFLSPSSSESSILTR